jgi:aldose sugar dehydrogenase
METAVRKPLSLLAAGMFLGVSLVGSAQAAAAEDAVDLAQTEVENDRNAPALDVTVVADGLDHPWDVAQAPSGTLLVDQRAGGLTAVLPDGTVREIAADFSDLFATGETG